MDFGEPRSAYDVMLIGQYASRLSEKGRAALPKKFRVELGERVILSRWYETCLVVVSTTTWDSIINSISGGQVVTRPARDTDRFLLAGAFEAELDKQGRLIIPQTLREYAGLKNEIIFLWLGDRVEIWNEGIWQEHEKQVLEKAGELAQTLFEQSKSKEK